MDTSLSHPADRHLVGCEGACFVRADDGGTAKCLYRREGTDYSIFAGHAACVPSARHVVMTAGRPVRKNKDISE